MEDIFHGRFIFILSLQKTLMVGNKKTQSTDPPCCLDTDIGIIPQFLKNKKNEKKSQNRKYLSICSDDSPVYVRFDILNECESLVEHTPGVFYFDLLHPRADGHPYQRYTRVGSAGNSRNDLQPGNARGVIAACCSITPL